MPRYDYQCPEGHTTEIEHPIAACDEPRVCACGAALSRLIGKPAIGKPAFESAAILRSGEKIPGGWGRTPRKRRP